MGKLIDMAGWKMWEHGVPESRLTVLYRSQQTLVGLSMSMW